MSESVQHDEQCPSLHAEGLTDGLIPQVRDSEIVTESEIAYTQVSDSQRLRMRDIFT